MVAEEKRLDIHSIHKAYEYASPYKRIGKILSSKGLLYKVSLSKATLGSYVEFQTAFDEKSFGEVVSIEGENCYVMPYEDLSGVNSETKVILRDLTTKIKVGRGLLGRVIDFQCSPIDGKGDIDFSHYALRDIFGESTNPLDRPQIDEVLDVGINAINFFMTAGKGQRLAIMAGSGVGKSAILGMIARNTQADINIIALVGERGREVLEFIENDLTEDSLQKSVVVVATSEMSPLIRNKVAYVATTIAEYFRDQGNDVLLMMDSITRFAMANREISLSLGDPPTQRGYTPSVFSKLPKILERAGKTKRGSITGIYAVLVEGNDMDEPVTDAIRAIADGHIVLNRELASKNHFPAIDILQSISRVMDKVVTQEHWVVATHLRDLLAAYKENEDLINVGAYIKGSSKKVDKAIVIYDELMDIMKQFKGRDENLAIEQLFERLVEVARKAETEAEVQEPEEVA